ncbi:MAG: AMP-binding protein [Trebonia sp.]
MTNLAALLESTAATYPDRTAVVRGDLGLSYAQVDGASSQVANLLTARGVRPGDKVALSCPNLPCFTIIYYGILKTGAIVVPLNVLLKPREVAYHLADSQAVAYFAFEGTEGLPIGAAAWQGFQAAPGCRDFFLVTEDPTAPASPGGPENYAPLAAEQPAEFTMADVTDDDTAVILYTSGTTGQAKGAELRHRNMRDNALSSAALFAADAAQPDTYLCALPLFHSFGQTGG